MAKKALVVGINAYAPPNTLPSCVADAEGINSLLQGRYAFDAVTLLRDDEATKDKLVATLTALVNGTTADDRIVFYFSGHGYTFDQNGTMVEALVTQDAQFFDSGELKAIVQGVPPGTFTVVLDSCYSGGLEKLFQIPGLGITTAKVKSWIPVVKSAPAAPAPVAKSAAPEGLAKPTATPTVAAAARSVHGSFTSYEGFGFSSHDANLQAHFAAPQDKAFSLVASSPDAAVDRPFLLVSACMPNETAAASVEGRTAGRSAFTFCLLDRIDHSTKALSAAELVNQAGQQMRDLQLSQTPQLKEPGAPPNLGQRRFPTLDDDSQPSADGSLAPTGEKSFRSESTIPLSTLEIEQLHQLLGNTIAESIRSGMITQQLPYQKGFLDDIAGAVRSVVGDATSVASAAAPIVSGIGSFLGNVQNNSLLQQIAPIVELSQKTFVPQALTASKGYQPTNGQSQQVTPRGKLAAVITPIVAQALEGYQPPPSTSAKAYSAPQAYDKGWFDSITSIVSQVAPVVIDALKTYQTAPGQQPTAAILNLQQAAQKGWFDDLTHVVASVAPVVLSALKDFQPPAPPQDPQKGWFDDVLSVVKVAAPIAIAAI